MAKLTHQGIIDYFDNILRLAFSGIGLLVLICLGTLITTLFIPFAIIGWIHEIYLNKKRDNNV